MSLKYVTNILATWGGKAMYRKKRAASARTKVYIKYYRALIMQSNLTQVPLLRYCVSVFLIII